MTSERIAELRSLLCKRGLGNGGYIHLTDNTYIEILDEVERLQSELQQVQGDKNIDAKMLMADQELERKWWDEIITLKALVKEAIPWISVHSIDNDSLTNHGPHSACNIWLERAKEAVE